DDHGLAAPLVADDGAVALQGTDGKDLVDHSFAIIGEMGLRREPAEPVCGFGSPIFAVAGPRAAAIALAGYWARPAAAAGCRQASFSPSATWCSPAPIPKCAGRR